MAFILTEAKKRFFASDDAAWATEQLHAMVADTGYNTLDKVSYSPEQVRTVTFVDWNLQYLCDNPQISVRDYLSNLRLKTKIRPSR